MSPANSLTQLYNYVSLNPEVRMATKYFSPKLVLKITKRHKQTERGMSTSYVLTVGEPNYLERKFIADCKKAGVAFPVRKIQLRDWPKKRPVK